MNGVKTVLACGLLILATGCTPSASDKIDKVDELLRAELPMSQSGRERALALRDEARRLLQAGDTEAAAAAADQALDLLKRAKDASLMNKSDG